MLLFDYTLDLDTHRTHVYMRRGDATRWRGVGYREVADAGHARRPASTSFSECVHGAARVSRAAASALDQIAVPNGMGAARIELFQMQILQTASGSKLHVAHWRGFTNVRCAMSEYCMSMEKMKSMRHMAETDRTLYYFVLSREYGGY